MSASPAREPQFIQTQLENAGTTRAELLAGLHSRPAHVSPKYFYDALGSRLFEAITELPEYYPTRTEAAIVAANRDDIARTVGRGTTLIDLGAGNCRKAAGLFDILQPAQYVAVDISVDFLRSALRSLQLQFPSLPILGLGQDFSRQLKLPDEVRAGRRLFFYPGSSLGNFSPDEALAFLKELREQCGLDGGLLLGVDLVKDAATLNAAYDDALGVTAAFNLNLLRHLNGVVGADFRIIDWRHVAFFNAREARIEMHLEAKHSVEITLPTGPRLFIAGERIHTENSYKYQPDRIANMVQTAGFAAPRIWTDEKQWFAVCYAAAA